MIPTLTFLDESLTVEATEGLVSVTVTHPLDLVRDYCRFLDSLANFFGAVHRKSSISASLIRVASLAADPEARKNLQEHRERIVSAFDAYTCRGWIARKPSNVFLQILGTSLTLEALPIWANHGDRSFNFLVELCQNLKMRKALKLPGPLSIQ